MAQRRGKLSPEQEYEAGRLANFTLVFLSHFQEAAYNGVNSAKIQYRIMGNQQARNQLDYWRNVARGIDWLIHHCHGYAMRYVAGDTNAIRKIVGQAAEARADIRPASDDATPIGSDDSCGASEPLSGTDPG